MRCEQISLIEGLTPLREKDPSHANRGRWLEDYCEWTHAIYRREASARVDRNYPESKRLERDGFARVTGVALCDFSGLLAGGRAVAFDAKECGRKSIPLDTLQPHQLEHLVDVDRLGGIAFVLVAFGQERVYMVPASAWKRAWDAAELWRWHKTADGEKAPRMSLREQDMPGEWAVATGGRGVDWLTTVRRVWGCP